MVVKQYSVLSSDNVTFESSVISYGSEADTVHIPAFSKFESSVISYGSEANAG